MKYALLGLAVVCAGIFSGCISDRAAAEVAAVAVGGFLKAGLDPAFELARASNEFRVAKDRWPRDYDELSSFLKQTGDRTYPSFQAVKHNRINFTETSDGKLRIEADYTFNAAGEFNSGGTFSSSGTGRIDGMVVSPFDPHEMMLSPNPQGGANGRQPSTSQTNRTSAAAASRRSP